MVVVLLASTALGCSADDVLAPPTTVDPGADAGDDRDDAGVVPEPDAGDAERSDGGSEGDPPQIVQITAGEWHGCARYRTGEVACWGSYSRDHAPTSGGRAPTLVPGLTAVEDLTSGGVHVCALQEGTVYCWGNNVFGQLGDGSRDQDGATAYVAEPQRVPGLNDIEQIEAGQFHTCARDTEGKVYCWGKNDFKQADYSNPNPRANPYTLSPVEARGLERAIDLVAGQRTNCAMHEDREGRTLSCWGGRAGSPATWREKSGSFVDASYDRFVDQSPLGDAVCAHTETTRVNCRGIQFDAAPDWQDFHLPEGSRAPAIGGEGTLCAIQGANIWCGYPADGGGRDGCIGGEAPATEDLCARASFALPGAIRQVVIGGEARGPDRQLMCALLDSGEVYCWGPNSRGQVGDGTDTDRDTPTLLAFPT
jgi:hypothetical protein